MLVAMLRKLDLLSPIEMEMVCWALMGVRCMLIVGFDGGGSGEAMGWAWGVMCVWGQSWG